MRACFRDTGESSSMIVFCVPRPILQTPPSSMGSSACGRPLNFQARDDVRDDPIL